MEKPKRRSSIKQTNERTPLISKIKDKPKTKFKPNQNSILLRIIKTQPKKIYIVIASMGSIFFGSATMIQSVLLGDALGSFSESDPELIISQVNETSLLYLILGILIAIIATLQVRSGLTKLLKINLIIYSYRMLCLEFQQKN